MRTGFFIAGKLLGYKSTAFTNRETGEVKNRHSIGIELQEPNGYGGYNAMTQEIKIDERTVNDGLMNTINKFRNKNVMISVSPREWAMEGGRKGITYNFDESSSIEEIQDETRKA